MRTSLSGVAIPFAVVAITTLTWADLAAPPSLDFEAQRLELDATPMPFADWALVEAGNLRWLGPDGRELPLEGPHGLASADEAHAEPFCLATGVDIKVQPAEKRGFFTDLLLADHPWEEGKRKAQTLLFDADAGLYRAWYDCRGGVAYAESPDLVHWEKPLLNPAAFEGSGPTNLVYVANRKDCAASGMFQHPESLEPGQAGTFFVDPAAPPDERFKTTVLASATPDRLRAFAAAKGKPLSSRVSAVSANVLFPAVSADGIAWRIVPEPNLLHDADTQTVVFFDTRIQRYVAFTRLWELGRRVIARAESESFLDFPLPQTVLAPGASEAPTTDFYANAMARLSFPSPRGEGRVRGFPVPGRIDLQLMFVLAYDRRSESGEVRVATSRDGSMWHFTPGNPVLRPGAPGDWDSHWPMAVPSFVRTPDNDLLLLYNAYNLPHKFPRTGLVEGNQGIARWPAGRLFALEAAGDGAFCTPLLQLRGASLRLNVQTARAGSVQVEIRDREFKAVPGLTFDNADAITGDHPDIAATWKGSADLSALRDEYVYLSFRLRAAKLFTLRAE